MKDFVKDTPLRRFGAHEEVAAVAVFLASDEAAYMTGTELNIDGGMLAGSVAIPAVDDRRIAQPIGGSSFLSANVSLHCLKDLWGRDP